MIYIFDLFFYLNKWYCFIFPFPSSSSFDVYDMKIQQTLYRMYIENIPLCLVYGENENEICGLQDNRTYNVPKIQNNLHAQRSYQHMSCMTNERAKLYGLGQKLWWTKSFGLKLFTKPTFFFQFWSPKKIK